MNHYVLSEIYTLIPQIVYSDECGKELLHNQFGIKNGYTYFKIGFDKYKAVLASYIPNQIIDRIGSTENIQPFAAKLIEELSSCKQYNKVILHYSKADKLSHTVVCMGNQLKLANCFKVDSFESALYYLFLAVKQFQINPKQTQVMVCFPISSTEQAIIERYFNGVVINNLDNIIER